MFVNTWVSVESMIILVATAKFKQATNIYRSRAIDLKITRLENNSDSVGFRVQTNWWWIGRNFYDKRVPEFFPLIL